MAALSMYQGFVNRMKNYAEKGDEQQKRIAEKFKGIKASF